MPRLLNPGLLVSMAIVAGGAAACGGNGGSSGEKAAAADPVKEVYPGPRYPAYLKQPDDIEALMPSTRSFATTKAWRGGLGLGAVKEGETVLIVNDVGAEPIILDAITRAAAERKVTVNFKADYELVGVSRGDALAFQKLRQSFTAEQGYMEASNWLEQQFPDPEATKAWLKGRRPDVYDKLYPKSRDMSPAMQAIWAKLQRDSVGGAIKTYLKANPKTRGVFWGKGGGPGAMRALYPMHGQYLGFFTADNRWEMMSAIPTYPSDVWLLTEEQSMEPLAYVDRLEVKDPEGTNVWAAVTEEMALRWIRGAYQRGHLYLFPTQATGRFGYSVVDYPALQGEWIPREPMSLVNGVVAATNGHTGFYPRMEIEYKDGYIKEVRGGGTYGDTLRTFMQYPKINDLKYPFHDHPGFWYLYEIASGTHPKWFRNPTEMDEGTVSPERNRSGVVHWGVGLRLWHDPDAPIESKSWLKFTGEHNLPKDHGFHMHSYFATYRVHLRNADKWINLLDKGRLTSLDGPEVRALASRYGNPDGILAEDWIPEYPGINVPGDYMTQYAPDPWKYARAVVDKAITGKYEYYFPKPTGAATSGQR